MSIELKNTLFPRLCVTLRTFVLTERERTISDESPFLYFTSLDESDGSDDTYIESSLWGCEYLFEDDSDSEIEWRENDSRMKDMSALMENRYTEFESKEDIYLEVTDGIQVFLFIIIIMIIIIIIIIRIGLYLGQYVLLLDQLILRNIF